MLAPPAEHAPLVRRCIELELLTLAGFLGGESPARREQLMRLLALLAATGAEGEALVDKIVAEAEPAMGAAAACEALHTRKEAAGGTSAEDGAKALEATRAAALAAEHGCALCCAGCGTGQARGAREASAAGRRSQGRHFPPRGLERKTRCERAKRRVD